VPAKSASAIVVGIEEEVNRERRRGGESVGISISLSPSLPVSFLFGRHP
jgi:hypothetical protein